MEKTPDSVFKLVVPTSTLHKSFRAIKTNRAYAPARWMLDNIYMTFVDPDGNFLEQFQTTGFDTRFFELYLHAYFSRSGFIVERPRPNPDFIVGKDGVRVAVEATTVNPAQTGVFSKPRPKSQKRTLQESVREIQDEVSIRFGGPLTAKLRKRYWEQPHLKDLPLVIAVEAFFSDAALGYSDSAVARYVYGLEQPGEWDSTGRLRVRAAAVTKHEVHGKSIPSGFFSLPDSEHISAILFTNCGTQGKMQRMGFQHGIGNETICMSRHGHCFNPHRDAKDPSAFQYDLDFPPRVERWGEGLVAMHNPRALHPVPLRFFVDAVEHRIEDGKMLSEHRGWHPVASKTLTMYLKPKKLFTKLKYRIPEIQINAISKREFQAISGINHDRTPFFHEEGWYCDDTGSFLSVLALDRTDKDWAFVILARDVLGQFRAIDMQLDLPGRYDALLMMQHRILKLLDSPKRYFEQGDEFDHLIAPKS